MSRYLRKIGLIRLLYIAAITFAAIPLLAVSVPLTWKMRNHLADWAIHRQNLLVEREIFRLESLQSFIYTNLKELAQDDSIPLALEGEKSHQSSELLLKNFLQNNPLIAGLAIADIKHNLVSNWPPALSEQKLESTVEQIHSFDSWIQAKGKKDSVFWVTHSESLNQLLTEHHKANDNRVIIGAHGLYQRNPKTGEDKLKGYLYSFIPMDSLLGEFSLGKSLDALNVDLSKQHLRLQKSDPLERQKLEEEWQKSQELNDASQIALRGVLWFKNIGVPFSISQSRTVALREANRATFTGAAAVLLALLITVLLTRLALQTIRKEVEAAVGALRNDAYSLDLESQHLVEVSSGSVSANAKQAGAMRTAVTAIQQMSDLMKTAIEASKQVSQEAESATLYTQEGSMVVEEMKLALEAIGDASLGLEKVIGIISEIEDKTGIINSIVLKTQLLSFNASIEAARAGQHGRGFSVVAEEIGNLAQMSGESAKQIKRLLDTSRIEVTGVVDNMNERVQQGIRSGNLTSARFNDISRSGGNLNEEIRGIEKTTHLQEISLNEGMSAIHQTETEMKKGELAAQRTSEIARIIKNKGERLNGVARQLATLTHGLQSPRE